MKEKKRSLFIFTALCPVCKDEKELMKEMSDHMATHSVADLEAAGVTVKTVDEAGE